MVRQLECVVVALAVFSLVNVARAAALSPTDPGVSWTNTTGGAWGDNPNWSTGAPPAEMGSATFDLDAQYTVALDCDEVTNRIDVVGGQVTFQSNGHTMMVDDRLAIDSAAKLSANGLIVGDLLNAGTLAPGNSVGSLVVDGDLVNSGVLEFEIARAASYDRLVVTGSVAFDGTVAVTLLRGYQPVEGTTFKLISSPSLVADGFTVDLTRAVLPSGLSWDTSSLGRTGSLGVVPEPSTVVLLSIAAGALLVGIRRRRATRR